jgi:hypothetical protein
MMHWLCFFLWCFAGAAHAAETRTSLFFTADEAQKIETLAAQQSSSTAAAGDVQLGAVFYYGPDDWVLWLQGRKWTPESHSDDVRVLDVTPDAVRLSINSASGAPQDVRLKPHQTYRLATGDVVEGSAGLAVSAADK